MTVITLTPEQRKAVVQSGHVRIEDPETNTAYVLIRAEQFETMKSLLDDDVDAMLDDDVDAMYPLLAELTPEDWEDASSYPDKP
jgi:hypothetical protein